MMKHKLKIYKLHFTTPLHLSNEREDYAQSLQTLHSDTLYAALTASLAKIGYEYKTDFNGDLGFSISSLFPFYQKNKEDTNPIYFFPKSRKIDILPENMLEEHKKIKKIRWLETSAYTQHLSGNKIHEFYKPIALNGAYYSEKDIPSDFISSQVFPHVKVSRTGLEDAEPYYMERLFFKNSSGMFFIASGDCKLLEKGLEILQHEGIGTDRNVGNGYFEWKKDEIELNLPENAKYSMNLSLFLPEEKKQLAEMLDEKTAYSFKKRGGWVTTSPHNTIRKNRIYMFEEGSIFKKKVDKIEVGGRIADLTPEKATELGLNHKIFRNGKSLFIPINLTEKEAANE